MRRHNRTPEVMAISEHELSVMTADLDQMHHDIGMPAMQSAIPAYSLPEGALWRHSVAAAVAVDAMQSCQRTPVPSETFTAALLHDVGKLVMGRFMSPDHPLIDQHPENPQSWNLYAYARNNPLINIDPTGLGCITDLGQGSDANHESVEFNNSISSDDCGNQNGTWVPGDVSANNTGAYRDSNGDINFQATTNTGGNVYFSSFVSGAQTDANGVGPGASIAHASTDWLSSQIVGGSLDQMMSFAANRMEPRCNGPQSFLP